MHYIIYAPDKPNNLDRRMEVRPRHLAYWQEQAAKLYVAGPMLDDNGDFCGSMLIVEADTIDEVRALAEADPYWTDGVFGSMDITQINLSLGAHASPTV